MSLFFIVVCFLVVVWSTFKHLDFLEIDIEYVKDFYNKTISF